MALSDRHPSLQPLLSENEAAEIDVVGRQTACPTSTKAAAAVIAGVDEVEHLTTKILQGYSPPSSIEKSAVADVVVVGDMESCTDRTLALAQTHQRC